MRAPIADRSPAVAVPSGVPSQATVLIARVARAVRQRFDLTLAPLGLRQRHVVALSYLRGYGPMLQQALADQLCMDASSTVCLLNELEENGLVVRQRARSDRRRAVIELSSRGEDALVAIDQALETVEEEILAGLSSDERAVLHRLLSRLRAANPIEDAAPDPDDA